MDFLDAAKMRRHARMVYVGYFLIGIAVLGIALVLLFQSSGFKVTKNGDVIQNGLVFSASTPSGAQIYIDGKDSHFATNKRLVLPSGQYVLQYRKTGYYPWTRSLNLMGGTVNRYDYSFLFPRNLETSSINNYDLAPTLSTQSPDRRWLLVQSAASNREFSLYDLKDLTKSPIDLVLPDSVVEDSTTTWRLVEWANDNRHVLLSYLNAAGVSEFILLDRQDASQSLNLNKSLALNPAQIRLHDQKYDQYYLYDKASATLSTASLDQPQPLRYLEHVLAFKPYAADQMLYVTDDTQKQSTADTQLAVKLLDGEQTYTIRKILPGNTYLLDMAGYSGDMYIAAGVDTENKVVVYKDPIDKINNPNIGVAVQAATLKVTSPDYLAFSTNTRYVMTEHGNNFSVYDAEVDKTYTYSFKQPLDAPLAQQHASWMDGNRLTYVSGGKLMVFDADQTNRHLLMSASPNYQPAFTPDYKRVVTFAPQKPSDAREVRLTSTWLRITADR